MAGSKFCGWGESGSMGGGGSDGSMFLRMKAGNVYKVRLIAKPIRFFQHWEPVICRSPGPEDPLLAMGYTAKERYSIWVLDRNDNNMLKIMDFPPTVYKQIGEWKEAHNNDEPGGKNGPDFQIKVECPGSDRRRTRYTVVAIDRAPLTDEEKTRVKDGNIQEKLEEHRRGHTPEEIKAMLAKANGDGDSNDTPSSAPQSAPATSNATQESSSSADDDLDF